MDNDIITEADAAALIRYLRDAAFTDRAARIARYVGGVDTAANDASLAKLAQILLRPDPKDSPIRWAEYQALTERTRFAAVFTAHPTFSLPLPVNQALAEAACGRPAPHVRIPPPAADHPAQRVRPVRRRHRQRPRRHRPLQQRADLRRPRRLVRPLDRAFPQPRHALHLGRLRHRRAHRYRLVGHAAAAAGDEAAAASPPARPGLVLPAADALAARIAEAADAVDKQIAPQPRSAGPGHGRRLRA